ncbi:MAG: c-type cytochrome [Flavobacteriales bacterium]|nr:c-type cytochrome [Flavobacteriales bacterium]
MRTFKKILIWSGLILLFLTMLLSATVALRQDLRYEAPFPDIHARMDSATIARGAYLVHGPAHCTGCHTDNAHEAAHLRGEPVPLHGGFAFHLPVGTLYSKNITGDKEHGIGSLTDAQIARSLRYGVGHDGRAIFDFMPFYMLSDSDLTAIISYLRTVPADPTPVPDHDLNMLGAVVKAFLVKPMGPLDKPRPSQMKPDTTAAYGDYLVNSVANCRGCHTARDLTNGAFIGPDLAGWKGMAGHTPGTFFNTPNLTPDPETGHLYNWTFDTFRNRFRAGPTFPDSPMPWASFARMSDDDLKAIWNYLRDLKPVYHETGPMKPRS